MNFIKIYKPFSIFKSFRKNILFKMEKNEKETAKFDNVLPNAEMGKVVTRFPPEPSGFLHIGHVKAAMLNYHYAKMYEGKMILRFDDTNPANEKDEYVQNIIKDLERLEIYPDQITHTSDHFDMLLEMMGKMISEGNAYCDNTHVDKMREERSAGVPSKCREVSVEDNLKIWEEMKKPTPSTEIRQYCVRGKMFYDHTNKCLRDPVFYRFSDEVHHKVGDKYKVFPTYDFACPIVDSHEGITHCLRSNEYSARIPMYHWVIEKLGLRKITIYEFSRLNMIHTVLSKRNLRWFVNNGIVDGWYDPRFPTVQGILRRGIQVKTLKEFMLQQGPSKNANLMEWDKIWAQNKDIIDPIAKRLFAVSAENGVPLYIENQSDQLEPHKVNWHPKDDNMGTRTQNRYNKLLIEYDDAKELEEGQKLTLYKWGNSLVTKIEKDNEKITGVYVKLTPEDTNFKKTKVAHWVPLHDKANIKVTLVEFDHLITAKKLDDGVDIETVVNKLSRYETIALAEIEITNVKEGEVIQLERRGNYYVDKVAHGDQPMILHFIPDGKSKTVSVVSMKVDAKSLAKGKDNDEDDKKKAKQDKKAEKEQKKAEKDQKKAEKKAEKKAQSEVQGGETTTQGDNNNNGGQAA
jgi:glutamyl-tRNA synthetase